MIKDVVGRVRLLLLGALVVLHAPAASAQAFDPRPSLGVLIAAFQQCGPPQSYQMLSPYLFNLIAQQTGGSGCYSFIAGAGAITDMQVIDSRQYPIGPVYSVRVTHVAGPVDWFIGFSQATGRVEYLTYQTVTSGVLPSVVNGPDSTKNLGGVLPLESPPPNEPPRPGGETQTELEKACSKFPQMCSR